MERDNSKQNGKVSDYGSRWTIKDNNLINFVLCCIWMIPINRLCALHYVGFSLAMCDGQVITLNNGIFPPEQIPSVINQFSSSLVCGSWPLEVTFSAGSVWQKQMRSQDNHVNPFDGNCPVSIVQLFIFNSLQMFGRQQQYTSTEKSECGNYYK